MELVEPFLTGSATLPPILYEADMNKVPPPIRRETIYSKAGN